MSQESTSNNQVVLKKQLKMVEVINGSLVWRWKKERHKATMLCSHSGQRASEKSGSMSAESGVQPWWQSPGSGASLWKLRFHYSKRKPFCHSCTSKAQCTHSAFLRLADHRLKSWLWRWMRE